jgi:hypothetical protein
MQKSPIDKRIIGRLKICALVAVYKLIENKYIAGAYDANTAIRMVMR